MKAAEGKPISQMFADDLHKLLSEYEGQGMEQAQAIGVVHMFLFNLDCEIREAIIRKERAF